MRVYWRAFGECFKSSSGMDMCQVQLDSDPKLLIFGTSTSRPESLKFENFGPKFKLGSDGQVWGPKWIRNGS